MRVCICSLPSPVHILLRSLLLLLWLLALMLRFYWLGHEIESTILLLPSISTTEPHIHTLLLLSWLELLLSLRLGIPGLGFGWLLPRGFLLFLLLFLRLTKIEVVFILVGRRVLPGFTLLLLLVSRLWALFARVKVHVP